MAHIGVVVCWVRVEGFDLVFPNDFDHVHRVSDLEWIFRFIENNVEFMVNWWEEAMLRNMHPKVNFKVMAESRFWVTIRHRESFAKLIFELGYYDKQYWQVDPAMS